MKLFRYLIPGTATYVVLHAMHRRSRGRNPSIAFNGQRNPRVALELAESMLSTSGVAIVARGCPKNVMVAIGERLKCQVGIMSDPTRFDWPPGVVPRTVSAWGDGRHGFADVRRFNKHQFYDGMADVVMLVWHANQVVPAESYRKAHFRDKKVDLAVCEDPNVQREQLGRDRSLIYHFA